jgi:hypothetical protein
MMFVLALLAAFGFCFNIWLYFDDIKNRDSALHKVYKDEGITDLMTSPPPQRREVPKATDSFLQYKQVKGNRDVLKRSMARASMVH